MKIHSNFTGFERRVCDKCADEIEPGKKFYQLENIDCCEDCMNELLTLWERKDE